jgi:ankyrin repeat protein
MDIFGVIYNAETDAYAASAVSAYLKGGLDANAKQYDGKSILWAAAALGRTAAVISLIQAHADLNAATRDSTTPLLVAIGNGYPEIARRLIKAGADVNIAN